MKTVIFITCLAVSGPAMAGCFEEASRLYGVPEVLLRSIAKVESGGNPSAVGKNKNGTFDYGLMQINSIWLPQLAKYGIGKDHLLTDPCVNLKVGAWILSDNIRRKGYGWEAVGAYNAGCKGLKKERCDTLRNRYANKVYRALVQQGAYENSRVEAAAKTAPAVFEQAKPEGIASIRFSGGDS